MQPGIRTFVVAAALVASCAPSLVPPTESVRVTGTVKDGVAAPVEVEVYERCSAQLYLFERCPGKLLGATRLARPGPFLVEVDPKTEEVSVIAFRGALGSEDACGVENRETGRLGQPVEITLASAPCPVKRPEPPRASARAPISGF